MRQLLLILAFVFTISSAQATEPCIALSEQDFVSQVLTKSDVIAYSEIKDFDNNGTDITVKTSFFARKNLNVTSDSSLRINGWKAGDNEPFFVYQKGDALVLFLKKEGDTFRLTNDEWKSCIPSVWHTATDSDLLKTIQKAKSTSEKEFVFRNFERPGKTIDRWMALPDLKNWIDQLVKN